MGMLTLMEYTPCEQEVSGSQCPNCLRIFAGMKDGYVVQACRECDPPNVWETLKVTFTVHTRTRLDGSPLMERDHD